MSAALRRAVALACLPATRLASRLRPGIRILMYHRVRPCREDDQLSVSPERFERQIAHLASTRRVLSLADAVAALATGSVEPDSVAVTFDDGYLDNLVYALPVLRRHAVPATIFVTTEFCDQTRSHPRYPAPTERLHMDWDEVRVLAREPGITIGSHTISHPFLQRLGEAEARREIAESRRRIQDELHTATDFFCYPSGDVTVRESRLAREAGYRAAVTVAPGANRPASDPWTLRRTEVTDCDEPRDLSLKLAGAFDPVHAALHWRRRRAFAAAARSPHMQRGP